MNSLQGSRKYIIPFLSGVLIAGSIGVILSTISTKPEPATENLYEVEAHCYAELTKVVSAHDAFLIGEGHFGGDRPYNLTCAKIAYAKAAALDVNKELNTLLYQQGRISFLEGHFDVALKKFDTQIELFADQVPPVYYMIGLTNGFLARKTGNKEYWRAAEEGFLTYIPYEPEAPWPRVDLAWVYFSQGEFEKMLPILEQGLEFESENPWLLNMYGLALMNVNRFEEAQVAFEDAQIYYARLTPEDWGRTYPGNDPLSWDQGLGEFGEAIKKNLEMLKNRL